MFGFPVWECKDIHTEVMAVRMGSDGQTVAAALGNGRVALVNGKTGYLIITLSQSSGGQFPSTTLRFLPYDAKRFITATSNGIINQMTTENPAIEWTVIEKNQIFSLDINAPGSQFVTAGLDQNIRLYDLQRHQELAVFNGHEYAEEGGMGHTNRVFSIKFDPVDPHLIYSSGWDDTIQIWDTRTRSPANEIFGVRICGDALDVCGNILASGSWRIHRQIQLWDARMYSLISELKFNREEEKCLIYSMKIHPSGKYLYAGGSGTNNAVAFDLQTMTQIDRTVQFPHPVFSIAFDPDAKHCLIGSGSGQIIKYPLQIPEL